MAVSLNGAGFGLKNRAEEGNLMVWNLPACSPRIRPMLNRRAASVGPKKPFRDWLRAMDDDDEAVTLPLPPYSYVPGHGLPHPVNDPAGHLYGSRDSAEEPLISEATLAELANEPAGEVRRRAFAAAVAGSAQWLVAVNLFNAGYYWESHEAWEAFWHALGRTTPEARFIQGLIHLAAACVKIREGKSAGVRSHAKRARELLGNLGGDGVGEGGARSDEGGDEVGEKASAADTLGLASESLTEVLAELESYRPECWHTSKFPVVRVLEAEIRLG